MAVARRLFRIKYTDKIEKKTIVLVAGKVVMSDFFGLIAIEQLIFSNQRKQIVLPEEDTIRMRFADTKKLHIPYHNIISIEEFLEDAPSLKKMPVPLRKETKNEQPLVN